MEDLSEVAALRVAQTWSAIEAEAGLIGHAILRHQSTRALPISFKNFPSTIEMYADFPDLEGADVCKATQTGISELFIQLHLEAAAWRGRIAALVLPTHSFRDRFVQTRINTIIDAIPEYRERAGGRSKKTKANPGKKGAENLKVKRFGAGSLLYLGANSANDFVEFSCDILTIDELDRCIAHGESNLTKARNRLRNSPYPQMFKIGNPSVPGRGIAATFEAGDGRQFFWKCPRCNERQPIDWFLNVVRKDDKGTWIPRDYERFTYLLKDHKGPDLRPVCRRCHLPFERDPTHSAWVAARPGRRRSYLMTRIEVMSDRLWDLYLEWLQCQGSQFSIATFYQDVLGLGYEDAVAKISYEMLERISNGEENDYEGGDHYKDEVVVAGVDVGSALNIVVDTIHQDDDGKGYRQAVFIGTVTSFEAVHDVIQRYHVDLLVIDAAPEMRKSQELRDWALWEFPSCVVWLARFHPKDRLGPQEYGIKIDHNLQVITVDRTQLLDATFEEIKRGERVFPIDAASLPMFFDQMKASSRQLDKKGVRYIWDEGSKADHYRLADAYARMAADHIEAGGQLF